PMKTNRILVAGKGTYIADIDIPGTLHMAVVRSPYAHARIRRVDTRVADALPGVVTTVVGEEIRASTRPMPTHSPALGEKPCPLYALAVDKVRYVGEPVAALAAALPRRDARSPGEPDPGHRARGRWRVRLEAPDLPRGAAHRLSREEARAARSLDRGADREPHGRRPRARDAARLRGR